MKNEEFENLINYQLKNDIKSFFIKSFYELNPRDIFIDAWYFDYLFEYLKLIESGKIKRLIINIPPRNSKSILFNVAFPAWCMMKNPAKKIISVSYSYALSVKHSMDFRRIIKSDWYSKIAENFEINKSGLTKQKIVTTQNGFRFATSINGTLVGDGCDLMIIDDPNNPVDVHSKTKRNKVNEWFSSSALTRLNNKHSAMILVMQRVHEEDLTGFITENFSKHAKNDWEIVKIPFLIEGDKKFFVKDKLFLETKENQTINPQRFGIEDCEKIKNQISEKIFEVQYQQNPSPESSVKIINKKSIQFEKIELSEVLKEENIRILSIDCASVKSNNCDYSVIMDILIKNNTFYILDITRKQMSYPEMKDEVLKIINFANPKYVLIEHKNNGIPLSQELGIYSNIVEINPKIDKISRLYKVLHIIENKMVKISFTDKDKQKIFFDEISLFPESKNDDQVDALTQALQWKIETQFNEKNSERNFRVGILW